MDDGFFDRRFLVAVEEEYDAASLFHPNQFPDQFDYLVVQGSCDLHEVILDAPIEYFCQQFLVPARFGVLEVCQYIAEHRRFPVGHVREVLYDMLMQRLAAGECEDGSYAMLAREDGNRVDDGHQDIVLLTRGERLPDQFFGKMLAEGLEGKSSGSCPFRLAKFGQIVPQLFRRMRDGEAADDLLHVTPGVLHPSQQIRKELLLVGVQDRAQPSGHPRAASSDMGDQGDYRPGILLDRQCLADVQGDRRITLGAQGGQEGLLYVLPLQVSEVCGGFDPFQPEPGLELLHVPLR